MRRVWVWWALGQLLLASQAVAQCQVSLTLEDSAIPAVYSASQTDLGAVARKASGFRLRGCDGRRVLFFHEKGYKGQALGPFGSDDAQDVLPAAHSARFASLLVTKPRCIAMLHETRLVLKTSPKYAVLQSEADVAKVSAELPKGVQAMQLHDCQGFRVALAKDATSAPFAAKTNSESWEGAAKTPLRKLTMEPVCLHKEAGQPRCTLNTMPACIKKEVFAEMKAAAATKSMSGLACQKWSGTMAYSAAGVWDFCKKGACKTEAAIGGVCGNPAGGPGPFCMVLKGGKSVREDCFPSCFKSCAKVTGKNYEVPAAAKYQDQVTAKCAKGYTRSKGSLVFTCGLNGAFLAQPTALECAKDAGCPAATVGNVAVPKADVQGQKQDGACKTGFTKKEGLSAPFVCGPGGAWLANPNPIQCEQKPQATQALKAAGDKPCPPFTRNNFGVAQAAKQGVKVKGVCDAGFLEKFGSTPAAFECGAGGQWVANKAEPVCVKAASAACAAFSRDNYAVPTANKAGDKATATCNAGFALKSGTTIFECGAGGKWKVPPFAPVCAKAATPVVATNPLTASKTACQALAKDNYKVPYVAGKGLVGKAVCADDFIKVSGSDTFTCGAGGKFTPPAPVLVCKPQPCPGVRKYNFAVPDGLKRGDIKTAKCDAGLKLASGTAVFTCAKGGKWAENKDLPVCIPAKTAKIPPIPNVPASPTAADVIAANNRAIKANRDATALRQQANGTAKAAAADQKAVDAKARTLLPALSAQLKAQNDLNDAVKAENKALSRASDLRNLFNLAKDPNAKASAKALADAADAEVKVAKAATATAQKKADSAKAAAEKEQRAMDDLVAKAKQSKAHAADVQDQATKMAAAAKSLAAQRDQLSARVPGALTSPLRSPLATGPMMSPALAKTSSGVLGLSHCCLMALRGGCVEQTKSAQCPLECGCTSAGYCSLQPPSYCYAGRLPASSLPASASCVDKRGDCAFVAKIGLCNKQPWVQANCYRSCNLCGCGKDVNEKSCWGWSVLGECGKNAEWMPRNCALSCCASRPGGVAALQTANPRARKRLARERALKRKRIMRMRAKQRAKMVKLRAKKRRLRTRAQKLLQRRRRLRARKAQRTQ